ncbi:MAG: hypothetical protein OEZ06_20770 [Myxococcales bacterium]|nr:hypothetical protein [Myxococcales bacterium]
MNDPLEERQREMGSRRRYDLSDDTGFNEVPRRYRKFYRVWRGTGDCLAPNEALCPVCKVVIRSKHELRPGDRIYCMACMTRLEVQRGEGGLLVANPIY